MVNEKSLTSDLIASYFRQYPEEGAQLLDTLETEEILDYLKRQTISVTKRLYANLMPDCAAEVLEKMEDQLFIGLFSELDPYLSARIISRLDTQIIKQKLSMLPSSLAREINELMKYPPDSAGFIMDSRVITFHADHTVKDVLKKIRSLGDRRIFNIYVVDMEGHLEGIVPLQIIAVSKPGDQLKGLLQVPPATIHAMATREDIVELLEKKKLLSLPVVDFDNILLGIIRNEQLLNATLQDATEDVQAMFGAGREERALSKITFAVRKRLPWLHINLATAFLAALVVGAFEDTIAKITVLAVFLPVVAGQSGNTGSQALAVIMRGLALREIRISQWFRVARKELAVGLLNGIAIAITTSLIVYFWTMTFGLAVVIAISMIFSMAIAGFSGAVIPMVLKSIGQDPAQSSSIILTTVTDVFGFLSFLGLATALASVLGIT